LKYLALRLARGEGKIDRAQRYLPIPFAFGGFCQCSANQRYRLDDFIAEYFDGIGLDLPVAPMLGEALKAGRALILLDGLDEVRDLQHANTVVERVVDSLHLIAVRK